MIAPEYSFLTPATLANLETARSRRSIRTVTNDAEVQRCRCHGGTGLGHYRNENCQSNRASHRRGSRFNGNHGKFASIEHHRLSIAVTPACSVYLEATVPKTAKIPAEVWSVAVPVKEHWGSIGVIASPNAARALRRTPLSSSEVVGS